MSEVNERIQAEWTKQRICSGCARPFALADHGHAGARSAAEQLAAGGDAGSVAQQCPACLRPQGQQEAGPGQAAQPSAQSKSEAEAIAAALAVEREMRTTSMRPILVNARRMGLFVAVMASIIFVMLVYLLNQSEEAGAAMVFWTFFFIVLIAGGVGCAVWAQVRLRRLSESEDPFGSTMHL